MVSCFRVHHSKLIPAMSLPSKRIAIVTSQSDEPTLRREYQKLFTAASKERPLFSADQLAQLDVYGLWAVLRPQLATDDSFVFNRCDYARSHGEEHQSAFGRGR